MIIIKVTPNNIFLRHATSLKKFHVECFAVSSEVILTLFTLNYNHGIVADCYLHMNILVQQPYILLNKLDLTKHIITQVHMHTATIIINLCNISSLSSHSDLTTTGHHMHM
jgi:hypothetical protein